VPKINPIKIAIQNGTLRHIAEYETHVLADGTFQTLIPDVDIDRLAILERGGVSITKNKADKPVLKSVYLADIAKLLNAYGRALLETEQTSTLLIFYSVTLDIAYCTNPHLPGEVFANGNIAKRETGGDNDYRWHGTNGTGGGTIRSARNAVGVSARVIEKTVHRLADGRFFVEHHRATLPDGSFGAKLNEFNTDIFPPKDYWSATDPDKPRIPPGKAFSGNFLISEGLHNLPYTEESAEFFFNMTMNLATLAERLRMFFGDGADAFLENLHDQNKLKLLGAK
jgi:hypothetical protein